MKSANLSEQELTDLIFYGIKENGMNPTDIKPIDIEIILGEYHLLCGEFQTNYVNGELDTFKRAACLLVAINNRKITLDYRVNASIALDAAYKMCETPYWNVGPNFDTPYKMEEVNFEKIFENNKEIRETSKNMLIDSLVCEKSTPLNYFLNLELFYQVALAIKHKDEFENADTKEEDETLIMEKEPKSLVRKLFNRK